MNPDDVASWLRSNPLFFEHYPALLADIQLPNPHGGKAIALGERQVQNLRERSRALEARLLELIAIGEDNDAIGNKMHRLVLGLLSQARQPGRGALIAVLHQHLREDFAVPHVALRLWDGAVSAEAGSQAEPGGLPSEALRQRVAGMQAPCCGAPHEAELLGWLSCNADAVKSVAQIPLRLLHQGEDAGAQHSAAPASGLLLLASEDPQRFYSGMGTLFLERLGELISAVLGGAPVSLPGTTAAAI